MAGTVGAASLDGQPHKDHGRCGQEGEQGVKHTWDAGNAACKDLLMNQGAALGGGEDATVGEAPEASKVEVKCREMQSITADQLQCIFPMLGSEKC